ncbi:MAG: SUMF1/EgtB/PvdO family nonheme iron enzyme [Polyangiaceae bacterium]|nr:SUMF1/EgtB/PvdO family nonheme iron enzyme [Polyangiaceae bacterium]
MVLVATRWISDARSPMVLGALVVLAGLGCDELPIAEARTDRQPSMEGGIPRPPSRSPAPAGSLPDPRTSRACPSCSGLERCDQGQCVPHCPSGEVFVPPTPPDGFELGQGALGEPNQRHRVILTRPFCMDATEVTVAAYRECVENRGCPLPKVGDINANYRYPDRDQHPVNMVALGDALAFCESIGKDLPTEAEWVWAAGHGDGRKYPWGNEAPTCENGRADFTPWGAPKSDPAGDVGCHGGGTSPVGGHPAGKSSWPAGDLHDLGGNVWEWTSDCSVRFSARTETDPHPVAHPRLFGDCYVYVLLGGAWNRSATALEVDWRAAAIRDYRVPGLGFRCVRRSP